MTDTESVGEPVENETAGISQQDARSFLVELVTIPSPSGAEARVAEYLQSFFEQHDREAWIDEVGNVHAPADDAVLLTSHLDTVPGDIPVRCEEEVLWGRGSVDAKGSLAAMAVAAIRTGVSFVGVVGEELDSSGAHHLVEERDPPEIVINGEPSGWNGITLGYRGLLGGTYVSTSESGHTSRPDNNAIQHAMHWWQRVEDAFQYDNWDTIFDQVTTKPVGFEGGTVEDGLSVEATLDVQLRVPPDMTTDAVREIADGELREGTVHWWDDIPPVIESPRTVVARAFRAAIRQEGGEPRMLRKTGTSDMNVYAAAWDVPIATYGPGDSDLDHAPNEHLALVDYDRSIAVLERVATRLSNRGCANE